EKEDVTCARRAKSGHDPEERGLPTDGGADHAEQLVRGNLEADLLQHLLLVEGVADTVDRDPGAHRLNWLAFSRPLRSSVPGKSFASPKLTLDEAADQRQGGGWRVHESKSLSTLQSWGRSR